MPIWKKESLLWGILLLTLASLTGCKDKMVQQPPPPEINVVEVFTEDIPVEKDFVGQIYGILDIPIRARVEGFLEGIHFQEGRGVKRGQLLYSIDQQPFQAAVAQRKHELAEAKIAAVKAQNDLNRIEPLAEINAVSKSDLDAALAEKGAADAAVEAFEAALRMAEIELSYTRIKAPTTGLIGKTQAKVGEFVGKSPNPVILNTVSQIDSVRVEFFLTEQDYLALAREFLEVLHNRNGGKLTDKEEKREEADLQLILADGSIFKHAGKVDFLDREVDPATGALLVQATFPNPDRLVRPGQFARVRVLTEVLPDAKLIPQRCVIQFQGQNQVLVVNDSSKVEQRNLRMGSKYKDYWIVNEGLETGDKVVMDGIQKVREGMPVKANVTEFKSQFNPNIRE